MLINFTNHPSSQWGKEQLEAAETYGGGIVDLPFPLVPPQWDEAQLDQLAQEYAQRILSAHPQAVLCQGEMTLTYRVARLLMEQKILVLGACSERITQETLLPDGSVERRSRFQFVRFRSFGSAVETQKD